MESIIKYKFEKKDTPLALSEAINAGCKLSKKSLVNYILTNNTNAVFPVAAAEPVFPIYPVDVYENYKDSLLGETEKNIEALFNRLLIENIELLSRFKQKALLLSGGIDSILVAGVLAKQYGPENLRFYHMRHGSFTKGETERARTVAKNLGVKLIEINKGPFAPEDYIEPIKVNGHSVDLSAPSYLEVCRQIEKEQGTDVDVFNGELNLIDVGFSESSDPTRSLRRFIFSHLGFFCALSSFGWKAIPKLPGENKYIAVLNEIASMIFRKSDKRQFVAGFYTGKAHFPGFYSWENACGFDHRGEIDKFLERVGYEYQQDFKKFLYQTAPAFYSGTTNVETVGSFIIDSGMNYIMPYSSPSLASVSLNLPDKLARNKKVQKQLAVNKYGIDPNVAFYLKNHSGYNQTYSDNFESGHFKKYVNSRSFEEKYQLLSGACPDLKLDEAYTALKKIGVIDQKTLRLFLSATSFSEHKYL